MNNVTQHRIEKVRIELTLIQYMGHYSIALLPLMIPAMELYFHVNDIQAINSFSNLAIGICFVISGVLLYFKHRELIKERLYESRTNEEFKDAVFATANKMKWIIEEFEQDRLKATATNYWRTGSWSSIAIKREPKYVEIKSIFTLFLSAPDIFGTNKQHRRAFLRNYILSNQINDLNDRVISEINRKEQEIENEPEWNLKNTLKRIIAYVFSLAFLSLGIAAWKYDGFTLMVPILIIVGTFYIILDLYVMYTKMKKASS